jgi:hypothetical protein
MTRSSEPVSIPPHGPARPLGWVSQRLAAPRWRDLIVAGWILAISVLLLGPALGQGYTLSYDMVFVPRQDLLPASIGLGGGLPRAVPQDAVVALVTSVISGAVVQHVVLLAIPVLTGFGVVRLLHPAGRGVQMMAVTVAIWNPFVIERLVHGHWALLLAYAATPWAIDSARRLRQRGVGAASLVGWCALGALVPSGGLLVALMSVPVAVVGGVASTGRKVAVSGAVIACNLPWMLPSVFHPSSGAADVNGVDVFALRSEGPWGAAVTALGGGGLWNADAVPASRGTWLALILTLCVVFLGVLGWSGLRDLLGRAITGWWTVVAAIGWGMAVASAVTPSLWASAITAIPGGGLARDSHKLLAPLMLLLAMSAAFGARRIWQTMSDRSAQRSVMVAGILLPMAFLPDGAWGVSGRLSSVEYPAAWQQMREFFEGQTITGDVIVLPWSAFRRYSFNPERTVLDPTPRWLPRSSITADELPVRTDDGIVVVSGDDPRSVVVGQVWDRRQPLAEVMPSLGARWILIDVDHPPSVDPALLVGLDEVFAVAPFSVWELSAEVPLVDADPPPGEWVVITIDIAVLLGLTALAARGIGRGLIQAGPPRRRSRDD